MSAATDVTTAARADEDEPLEVPEPPDTGTLTQTWEQWDESLHARDVEGGAAVEWSAPVESIPAEPMPAEPVPVEPARSEPARSEPVRGEAVGALQAGEVEMMPPPPSSSAPVAQTEESDGVESDGRANVGRRRPSAIVRENLRPRVEKMREASIVVMEEASEDTGLRFVLIAVALFVLFLLFLFISSFLR
ncbi:MAG TPA: hypothetical protein VF754_03215 [Pyrinomonadaceae bacterium]